MGKIGTVETDGTIMEALPRGRFKTQLENGHILEAHISKEVQNKPAEILIGASVTVEMSPYNLTIGKIVAFK